MKFVAIFLGPIVLLGCMSVVSADNKTTTNLIMGVFDNDCNGIIDDKAEVAALKSTFTDLTPPANGASYYFVFNNLEQGEFEVSDDQRTNMTWANRIGEAYDKDNNHVIDGTEIETFRVGFNLTNEQIHAIDADTSDGGIKKMEIFAALTSNQFVISEYMRSAGKVMDTKDVDCDGGINGSTELFMFGKALGLNLLQLIGVFDSMDDMKITVNEIEWVIKTGPTIVVKLKSL